MQHSGTEVINLKPTLIRDKSIVNVCECEVSLSINFRPPV